MNTYIKNNQEITYIDDKVVFNDAWINQFSDQGLKNFLRIKLHTLDFVNSKPAYITVEKLIDDNPIYELLSDAFYYMLGRKRTTYRNYIKSHVKILAALQEIEDILEKIYGNIEEGNK